MTNRVKKLSVSAYEYYNLGEYPNFHKSGSIRGMKRLCYGNDALLVRCGDYIYNVSSNPTIYEDAY